MPMNRPRGVVEQDVEPRDRLDLEHRRRGRGSRLDRQERRGGVRRRERLLVQRDTCEQVRGVATETERPRHAQRLQAAGHRRDDRARDSRLPRRGRRAHVTCTLRERPLREHEVARLNGELQRLGLAVDVGLERELEPPRRDVADDDGARRVPAGPSQSPKPSVAGDVATSPTAAAPSRKTRFPTASVDARPRCAYPRAGCGAPARRARDASARAAPRRPRRSRRRRSCR